MTTETAATAAPTSPPTEDYAVTRGGWYLLEALLQLTEPFKKKGATKRALRLRRKIRLANPAKRDVAGEMVEFEGKYAQRENETQLQWANRQVARDNAWIAWQNESLTISLTKKEQQFIVSAGKWALDHRDKSWPQNNDHVLSILEAFPGMCDEDPMEDSSDDDDEDGE